MAEGSLPIAVPAKALSVCAGSDESSTLSGSAFSRSPGWGSLEAYSLLFVVPYHFDARENPDGTLMFFVCEELGDARPMTLCDAGNAWAVRVVVSQRADIKRLHYTFELRCPAKSAPPELAAAAAETALVVGNYHSLLQNAPEALRHFARAVRLCPRATQAWLLLGYEYLNAHNVRAATAAYRAALDVDPHEFRAWHGLAQTYLMLHQRLHAVYYARRACELQPADPRMWDFLAQCYSEAGDLPSALRASVRAFCLAPEFVHHASFPFSFLSCACFSFSLPFVCLQQRWQLCTGAGVAVQGNEAEPAVGRLLQARGRGKSAATEPRGRAPVARRVLSRCRPRRRLPQRVPAHHRHRQRPAARGCQGAPGPAPSLSSPRLFCCPLSASSFYSSVFSVSPA